MQKADTACIPDSTKIGLGLYIHVPWCLKKCPYCDFNSHTLVQNTPFDDYVSALIADAQAQAVFAAGRMVDSIFIGGGTPSLLPIEQFARLFKALYRILPISSGCEITLEANPATLERAFFEDYLALGINRLSIGVQSFDNQALSILGRVHNQSQAASAIMQARKAGFTRINVDIMHGLPNQTPTKAVYDLQSAIDAGASHLSWYQLTIEPNTAFYRKPPDLPNENMLDEIEVAGRALLNRYQFDNYEISAWAGASDKPCWHNMNYWRFGDYLAIGAGAHGKVTLSCDDGLLLFDQHQSKQHHDHSIIYRFAKSRLPKDYLSYSDYPKFVQVTTVSDDVVIGEFMMNALRLRQGVSVANFKATTGLSLDVIKNKLTRLQGQGLMVDSPDVIAPTKLGFRYVNHLVQAFL